MNYVSLCERNLDYVYACVILVSNFGMRMHARAYAPALKLCAAQARGVMRVTSIHWHP